MRRFLRETFREARYRLLDYQRAFTAGFRNGNALRQLLTGDVIRRLEALERKLPPTLEDFGVNVVGCSACAVTPMNRSCPGCGNPGLAPVKRKRRKGAKGRKVRQ